MVPCYRFFPARLFFFLRRRCGGDCQRHYGDERGPHPAHGEQGGGSQSALHWSFSLDSRGNNYADALANRGRPRFQDPPPASASDRCTIFIQAASNHPSLAFSWSVDITLHRPDLPPNFSSHPRTLFRSLRVAATTTVSPLRPSLVLATAPEEPPVVGSNVWRVPTPIGSSAYQTLRWYSWQMRPPTASGRPLPSLAPCFSP